MPTSSEQKALAFIAIVILLGGAVRVVRAGSAATPTAGEQQAIARQAGAADSAASKRKPKGSRRATSRRTARDTTPTIVGGVATVPPSFARPDRPYDHTPYGTSSGRNGFPPPDPRIDTDARGGRAASPQLARTGKGGKVPPGPIDLDTASPLEIETLPRIGPAFAKRIVASRDSLGPFASLDGLKRVKGMGKATLAQLAPLVTFSGSRHPH
ncbi:MAG: helix-hairpin-helix domain-containing protein [Gemmatimonadaceae bacterium]